jgi:hypothetical protein
MSNPAYAITLDPQRDIFLLLLLLQSHAEILSMEEQQLHLVIY